MRPPRTPQKVNHSPLKLVSLTFIYGTAYLGKKSILKRTTGGIIFFSHTQPTRIKNFHRDLKKKKKNEIQVYRADVGQKIKLFPFVSLFYGEVLQGEKLSNYKIITVVEQQKPCGISSIKLSNHRIRYTEAILTQTNSHPVTRLTHVSNNPVGRYQHNMQITQFHKFADEKLSAEN